MHILSCKPALIIAVFWISRAQGCLPSDEAGTLDITVINKYSGAPIGAYVVGQDEKQKPIILRNTQGAPQLYCPSTKSKTAVNITEAGLEIPLGEEGDITHITLPSFFKSGRLYISEGPMQLRMVEAGTIGKPLTKLVEPSVIAENDPSYNLNYGFIELNYQHGELWVNLSFVDWVAKLLLGFKVTAKLGSITKWPNATSREVQGLQDHAVAGICNELTKQAKIEGQPWGDLCVMKAGSDELIRVLSPNLYSTSPQFQLENATPFMSGYWAQYVDKVWRKFTNKSLTINTQVDRAPHTIGEIECHVGGDILSCGDRLANLNYSKPTSADIFSCDSGPFQVNGTDETHSAVVARLCAAFQRSTLLLDGGDLQPNIDLAKHYYLHGINQKTVGPTNHYSRVVHGYLINGVGYAFPYDDVSPIVDDQAGLVHALRPKTLEITVRG